MSFLGIPELKRIYASGGNVMAALRESTGKTGNSPEAVKISYDLQSGSYTRAWSDPETRKGHDAYCAEIAAIISGYEPNAVLEAGVGEATTLCSIVERMTKRPSLVAGFDISWSRIHFGRRHAASCGFHEFIFCTGQLERIPFPDNAFDIVYTAHAVEPNRGREAEILCELLRVARSKVILFEPSYELGGAETKARIEEHGYCRDLPAAAIAAGGRIIRHELLRNPTRATNATACLVVEKSGHSTGICNRSFACSRCTSHLDFLNGHQYCKWCATVFPVIDGIPCLLPENGILAVHYADNE